MNVISRPAIREAQQQYPDANDWLENWWQVAKLAQWQSLHDVRATTLPRIRLGDAWFSTSAATSTA